MNDKKTHKINLGLTIELSNEDINDLMACALEGGINYWCGQVRVKDIPKEFEGKYEYASEVIALGGVLELHDAESDDKWELTLEKFFHGVKLTCEDVGFISGQDLMENHDADTADAIIQLALFNEIVFG